ncbi:unnamed protein product, partial [Meganyctiphanes norvegica]|uniref:Phosphatidic acid phosphatase type 2/haloperoxidase domain-containing protein n=1 Tax=Meganyctiphanes norvegica TaxID=48144 RepID=A0AAV2R264_MEGNR
MSIIHVYVNFMILCLVMLSIYILFNHGKLSERGFYCNDDSLQYPLLKPTVSTIVLLPGVMPIPMVVIVIVELLRKVPENNNSLFVCKRRLPAKLMTIGSSLGYYFIGFLSLLLVTEVTKKSIGRLRPHFHAVCQTDWNSVTCSKNTHSVYVESFSCLNSDLPAIQRARESFFSGHAGYSAYFMVYLIIYIQFHVQWRLPALIKPLMQLICLLITVYISLSRVFDYHHFLSDVLFGFFVGTSMALLVTKYVSEVVTPVVLKEKSTESVPMV